MIVDTFDKLMSMVCLLWAFVSLYTCANGLQYGFKKVLALLNWTKCKEECHLLIWESWSLYIQQSNVDQKQQSNVDQKHVFQHSYRVKV